MAIVMLLLFVGGIGLTLGVSDPEQVTLRWLRLGGLIAISLTAVAAVILVLGEYETGVAFWLSSAVLVAVLVGQLLLVQTAKRLPQRLCCFLVYLASTAVIISLFVNGAVQGLVIPEGTWQSWPVEAHLQWLAFIATTLLSAGMLGGFLMAMLLGHAYLTAGNEMTQAPFRRLVILLVIVIAGRVAISLAAGLTPYWSQPDYGGLSRMWDTMMVWARYLVGIVMPAVFTYMIYDCVKRRSNQSATGILYVAGILVILGEGIALALWRATAQVF